MKIFLYAAVLLVAYLNYASSAAVDPAVNSPISLTEDVGSDVKPEDNKDLEPQETWGFGYPRYYGGWGGIRRGWGGYGYGYPRSYGYGGWGYPRYYGGYGGYRGGFGWGGWGR